jgi:hypothetical protein
LPFVSPNRFVIGEAYHEVRVVCLGFAERGVSDYHLLANDLWRTPHRKGEVGEAGGNLSYQTYLVVINRVDVGAD